MCARCALLVASILGASCAAPGRAPAKTVLGEEAIPLRLPEGVSPVHYAVRLTLDPKADRFRGTSTVDVDLAAPTRAIWLHGRDLVIDSATFEGPG
ncbi:MAG: peptidase M1, partial [Anaeromyxobacteraceae bacterium]